MKTTGTSPDLTRPCGPLPGVTPPLLSHAPSGALLPLLAVTRTASGHLDRAISRRRPEAFIR